LSINYSTLRQKTICVLSSYEAPVKQLVRAGHIIARAAGEREVTAVSYSNEKLTKIAHTLLTQRNTSEDLTLQYQCSENHKSCTQFVPHVSTLLIW
jgi:hypothetical protein